MPLEHEPFGFGQCAWLAEDLFGDPEFAEVVQARREAYQLGLLGVESEPRGDPGREPADPLTPDP